MTSETFLTRLVCDGYRVRTDGETLWVSPNAGMPSGLRAEIVAHKAEMIAQCLFLAIWRELEASRARLPERPDGERWVALLLAYERLSLALPAEVTDQLELFGAGVAA